MSKRMEMGFEYLDKCLGEQECAKRNLEKKFELRRILGTSSDIRELRERLERVSSCDVNVLITGESGTGKELAARAIHYLGRRSGKPFIPINCGAVPENLFENELFGHVKGAFTDAVAHRMGLVGEAEGGTLFLDEIGVISPYLQVKFLRLLQDREYKPLGDPRPRSADVRIIAATNSDLAELVKEGSFREDLYYRLNIISVHLSPLRERREDIPLLVRHFIHRYSTEHCGAVKEVSDDVMEALVSYSWPGNVRELENKIQQIVVMCGSSVATLDDLPLPHGSAGSRTGSRCLREAKKKFINDFERGYLTDLLRNHKGDMVSASASAGKSRTALWNLVKKHHLSPKQFRT